ncbi:MAG: type II toxin-antitoxin system VapC family toxin [Burkholderiales bacterium]|nr:type II toxin-antitoxin system VapC family toxin [Burkholderiales bacterium]
MRLLLDTHVLVWWLLDDPGLSKRVAAEIRDPRNEVFVSSASAWEIATKYRLGRMPKAEPLVQRFGALVEEQRWVPLPVSIAHALHAGSMEGEHADPFDRMLAAQARLERLRLVTGDRALTRLVASATALW